VRACAAGQGAVLIGNVTAPHQHPMLAAGADAGLTLRAVSVEPRACPYPGVPRSIRRLGMRPEG